MKAELKHEVLEVDAVQWFKLGDHDAVTKIYGAGDMIDDMCGHPSHTHGFLKTPDGTVGVCPGDWIVTNHKKQTYRYRKDEFDQFFNRI